jgi:hypothetical protein
MLAAGVGVGPDESASLAMYIRDNADIWANIVAKYGLASGDLRSFVGQGDQLPTLHLRTEPLKALWLL